MEIQFSKLKIIYAYEKNFNKQSPNDSKMYLKASKIPKPSQKHSWNERWQKIPTQIFRTELIKFESPQWIGHLVDDSGSWWKEFFGTGTGSRCFCCALIKTWKFCVRRRGWNWCAIVEPKKEIMNRKVIRRMLCGRKN
jgi:hypothetical protein